MEKLPRKWTVTDVLKFLITKCWLTPWCTAIVFCEKQRKRKREYGWNMKISAVVIQTKTKFIGIRCVCCQKSLIHHNTNWKEGKLTKKWSWCKFLAGEKNDFGLRDSDAPFWRVKNKPANDCLCLQNSNTKLWSTSSLRRKTKKNTLSNLAHLLTWFMNHDN